MNASRIQTDIENMNIEIFQLWNDDSAPTNWEITWIQIFIKWELFFSCEMCDDHQQLLKGYIFVALVAWGLSSSCAWQTALCGGRCQIKQQIKITFFLHFFFKHNLERKGRNTKYSSCCLRVDVQVFSFSSEVRQKRLFNSLQLLFHLGALPGFNRSSRFARALSSVIWDLLLRPALFWGDWMKYAWTQRGTEEEAEKLRFLSYWLDSREAQNCRTEAFSILTISQLKMTEWKS